MLTVETIARVRREQARGKSVRAIARDLRLSRVPAGPDESPARAAERALSEQRQVVCVGRSTRRPKRRLGREGAPLGQRGGAPLFVNLAGDEMALLIEMVVDLGMN